jgi:hypothetical protein
MSKNSDSRTVHTDALETLGSIIDENEKRDAIHLAVCPVVAQEELVPGQHVGPDGTTKNPVGIVDPFLETSVNPGERFWLVIYPRKISSLRHVWSHPNFPDEIAESSKEWLDLVASSKEWMKNFCEYDVRQPITTVLQAAEEFINHGEETCFDRDCDYDDDFWYHYEIITGKKIDESNKVKFFTCSC